MDKPDIKSLMAKLACDDIIECQKARRSLVKMGHEAVPSLVAALGSKRSWTRWEAAKALSQIGDPAATGSLVKALQDKEFDVRWLAAEGLIAIGKKAVTPLLRALIDNPESVWLREGAHHVLHDMDRGGWDDILKPVMVALEDVEPALETPAAAGKALGDIRDRTA
jgi:HEAT repeat protein